jgi:hypothetical protein
MSNKDGTYRALDGTILINASRPLVEDFDTWKQKQKGSAVEGSDALKWKSEPLSFMSRTIDQVQLDREANLRKRPQVSSKWVK